MIVAVILVPAIAIGNQEACPTQIVVAVASRPLPRLAAGAIPVIDCGENSKSKRRSRNKGIDIPLSIELVPGVTILECCLKNIKYYNRPTPKLVTRTSNRDCKNSQIQNVHLSENSAVPKSNPENPKPVL